jgi:flagellar hook-associated protein 2
MSSSIISSLGMGSGIDTVKLVADLAAASREPKVERMATLTQANQTRISAMATARSNLDGFADSLELVVSDGTLRSLATSSDESVISVTSRTGLSADNINATFVVNQLARAQTNYSAVVADKAAAIGQGSLTLTVGSQSYAITIDSSNDSLTGLAQAINSSGSGVTASIVSDEGGSRLVLKGQTGAANSFTLSADAGGDANLANFATEGGGMQVGQTAANAEFTVDGIAYGRANNIVDDVLEGLSVSLKKASPGQLVDIGATRPLDMLRQTVSDFVDVFNQLKGSINDAGKLSGVTSGMRQLEQELTTMLGTMLTSHGSINKLTDIGVSINRDGKLTLDRDKLDQVLTSDAGAVEAMFNPLRDATHNSETDPGIAGVLDALRDKAVGSGGIIDRISTSLTEKSQSLAEQLQKIEDREAAYKKRLEKQYSGLDAKLAAYKATQSYLEQQIEIWNNQYKN